MAKDENSTGQDDRTMGDQGTSAQDIDEDLNRFPDDMGYTDDSDLT
jgi:hypothetical protein